MAKAIQDREQPGTRDTRDITGPHIFSTQDDKQIQSCDSEWKGLDTGIESRNLDRDGERNAGELAEAGGKSLAKTIKNQLKAS